VEKPNEWWVRGIVDVYSSLSWKTLCREVLCWRALEPAATPTPSSGEVLGQVSRQGNSLPPGIPAES
jgi:hypothetical protein